MAKICQFLKIPLFWIVLTSIICFCINLAINIAFSYLWLYLINKLPESILFIKYLLILILLFYNWYVLRTILISWLFEWQFPIQKFSIYKERQNYITYLKLRLKSFKSALDAILDSKYKISKKEIEDIELFIYLFDEEYTSYDDLYNIVNSNNNNLVRYKMSRNQINYYNLLKAINHVFNEDELKTKLLNLKENLVEFNMNIYTDNQNFENQKNLAQLNALIRDLERTVAKYDWNNYTYMSPAYLYNLLFNDTFGSLSLNSLRFKKKLGDYQMEENFTPKGKVHYTLFLYNSNNIIKSEKNIENNLIDTESMKSNNGALLLFCLPNGGCYELIPKIKIDFYLANGFSFLCWNYNGYGFSKGRANFSNCKTNIIELYDIIVNNPKYNFTKICVMGHSIGGVAACHLAKKRHVDLLICDRNFCDMPRLVNNLHCGNILSTLMKGLFIGETDNISNFMTFSNVNKNNNSGIKKLNDLNNENKNDTNRIIIYSPIDMLILNDATIKSGVSRFIIKKYIIYRNHETNGVIKDKDNLLDIVFNKNEKSNFINNFLGIIHFHYDKNNDFIIKNENEMVADINNQNNKNIDENNTQSQDAEDILYTFFDKFFRICCDNLNFLSTCKVSLRRETIFLDNFFNNLLIWGVQGEDSQAEDYNDFYSYKGKELLKEVNDILINFNSQDQINISRISRLIKLVSDDITKILRVMNNLEIVDQEGINIKKENIKNDNLINDKDNLKEKLISKNEDEINTNIDSDINKENILIVEDSFYDKLDNIKKGIKLFKTFAGHNGLLRPDEREQFFVMLLNTDIIS